ncbi:hypothetical protein [Alteromonas lipotrueae]|uniref:hypothetical protein n=1 Tax=Alteromonas lipotrueae TaxID=2803814 RepID=UPI001C48AEE1|nr:hypothetical protein [Alteromonas lipotrueae]
MDTSVVFKTELFQPFLPEDSQVIPKVYGAELAYWLAKELAGQGIYTSYPEYEDWGWFIEFIVEDNEYWLCCGNFEDEENMWKCFLKRHSKGLFKKTLASLEPVIPLLNAVRLLLEETPEISSIEWSSEHDT